MRKPLEPEYIGVAEAEQLTGISRWTWRKKAYAGVIASTKVGCRLLLPVAEVRRVMAEGLRPAVER